MNGKTEFFLGANSEKGFISYFEQLQEQSDSLQLLILKGGPGSGKSSLMKKVGEYAKKRGHITEHIMCASDPESLDALIDHTAQFAIVDGTAPHTMDPRLPGAQQHIIYTGDFWDTNKLKENRNRIAYFSETVGEHHKSATAYIKAAGILLSENYSYSKRYLDKEKTALFAQEVIKQIPRGKKAGKSVRLISAVSLGEIRFHENTIKNLADTIYIIEDMWGAASDEIFKEIEKEALKKKCECIVCPCSVMPEKTDHVILPEAKTAFCLKNSFFKLQSPNVICAENFYKPMNETLLMQNRLVCAEKLLSEACKNVEKAKKLHDELEYMYVQAMDFTKMEDVFSEIIERFYH